MGVLHSFSSGRALLEDALAMGWYASFSGMITFKKFEGADFVRMVPADRIMVETDTPYLAPVPHRGKTNEPAFVAHIAAPRPPRSAARTRTSSPRATLGEHPPVLREAHFDIIARGDITRDRHLRAKPSTCQWRPECRQAAGSAAAHAPAPGHREGISRLFGDLDCFPRWRLYLQIAAVLSSTVPPDDDSMGA